MEVVEGYSILRTFEPGRPPWGRWEVRDATGLLVGVVAEQPAPAGQGHLFTFTVAHNPSPAPFNMRFPRRLRARGAWWSGGHESVSAAVAALARHLRRSGDRPVRHYMTGCRNELPAYLNGSMTFRR
jgi:hypothetical protein